MTMTLTALGTQRADSDRRTDLHTGRRRLHPQLARAGPHCHRRRLRADQIDREFVREVTLRPKAEDKASVGGKELAWKVHQTTDYFIDFLQSFGKERGEYIAGYALAYVIADEDMKVSLLLSTNDQGKAWLNGREIFRFAETRVLDKDTDRVEVTLTKGQNVLLLKVINEVNNWQACARFVKDGVPVKTLKVALAPQ